MLDTVKQHPIISVAALLATVAVVFYVSTGDGEGGAVVQMGADPNAIAAGTALQQSQMQQQVAMTGINAQLQAEQGKYATAIALADINSKYGYDVAQLSAGVQLTEINKRYETQQLQSTLEAQSTQASIKAMTDQAAINANMSIQNNQTVAGVLINASTNQAQVAIANINAAKEIATHCEGIGCWF